MQRLWEIARVTRRSRACVQLQGRCVPLFESSLHHLKTFRPYFIQNVTSHLELPTSWNRRQPKLFAHLFATANRQLTLFGARTQLMVTSENVPSRATRLAKQLWFWSGLRPLRSIFSSQTTNRLWNRGGRSETVPCSVSGHAR